MNFYKAVFLFEAIVINAGVGIFCFFVPAGFVGQFFPGAMEQTPLELTRWYGVLLWVLAYAMLRILPLREDRMLFPLVEALLFGDLAHLAASGLFFQARPILDFPFLFMLGMSIFLAIVRIVWLIKYHRKQQPAA
ncbi:MAG: hypothetical protein RBS68_00225 [Anaerolineales bacterium]|jgi:hypothetical protein|nr:hypothetical protein [Anaerolineales bacterium]